MRLLGRGWVRAVFWGSVLGVLTVCLLPVDRLPAVAFDWWDKAQHALGFAWLALCGRLAYPRWPRGLPVGLLLLGAFIELAQSATGWRQGDVADWWADAVGVLAVWCATRPALLNPLLGRRAMAGRPQTP